MAVDFGTGYIDVEPRIDKSAAQSSMSRDLGSSLQSAGAKMTSAGKSLTAGLTLPIVGFGVAAVKAFNESAQVAQQTRAAIDSTGGAANVTADQVNGLANRISQYAAIDDEAVASGENMLLTFTNIRNEVGKGNDIFNQATTVLADVSARMGTDMSTSAIQLGKALNDPVAGIGSLSRIGVQFTEEQKRQVAQLVKHNHTLDAQKIILGELSKEFGGSARAQGEADQAAGGLQAATIDAGNAMESAGKTIAKTIGPILAKLAGWLQTAVTWFSKLPGPVKTGIVVFGLLLALLGPLLLILGALSTGLGVLTSFFTTTAVAEGAATAATTALNVSLLITIATIGLIVVAVIALAVIVVKNWDTIKRWGLAAWDAIKAAGIAVWNAIKAALTPFFKVAMVYFRIIRAYILFVWKVITFAAKVAWALIYQFVRIFFNAFKAIWNAIKPIVLPVWNAIKAAAGDVWHFITGLWRGAVAFFRGIWNGIKEAATTVWHAISDTVKTIFDGIVDVVTTPINLVIRGVNTLIRAFNKLPGPNIDEIPELARGGIITQPTLAMIGERGAEAVVPLSRLDELQGGGAGGRQVVSGTLRLTPDSRAYVEMVIDDDDAENRRHLSVVNRMRPAAR